MDFPLQTITNEDISQADSLLVTGIENTAREFMGMTWEGRFNWFGDQLWHIGLKVAVAVAIFIVGRWLIRRFIKGLVSMFERRKVDYALRTFVRSLIEAFLYFVLFYLIIAWLGVNTSLFVAMFAAAGLAIGMAMSGVFQNMAGGVMVLLLKPFKCGDWIELQDEAGTVTDIRLFNTVLRTADNRMILIPNGGIYTSIVTNNTSVRTRRLEWSISLSLGTDFDAVQKLLLGVLDGEKKLIDTRPREVVMNRLSNSSIDILIHAWVETSDYLSVFYRLNVAIYKALMEGGFDIGTKTQAIDVILTK